MQSNPAVEPLLWTTRQTAAALSVCEKTVFNFVRDGRLPVVHLGRSIRFDVADVRAFIDGAKVVQP